MVCHPLGNSPLRLQFTTFLEIPQISYPPLFLCRFQYADSSIKCNGMAKVVVELHFSKPTNQKYWL